MTAPPLRVLEFFSGIGGMRLSLEGALAALPSNSSNSSSSSSSSSSNSNINSSSSSSSSSGINSSGGVSVTSFDTSELVNQCYRLNFPGEAPPRQVNIESVKLAALEGAADVWTMSPPCQPFTTTANSKRLDVGDNRNKAFMYLMNCLEKMINKPEWIFFENVSFCRSCSVMLL
jgi:tRNA (cytosine38-C5)-methyltransferase